MFVQAEVQVFQEMWVTLYLVNCILTTSVSVPANHLWKGVTSVSNAGKKRGRGKNVSKSKIKDLNRGQVIGVGK